MNVILVHGTWVDGSSWYKVIPILQNSMHNVIAVQLSLYSLQDDIATVKRTIEFMKWPVILVGHSYGGFVITNAAYNNSNVKGLVYLSAFAPNEGQSISTFVDSSKFPQDFFVFYKQGFFNVNLDYFHHYVTQDIDIAEAKILSATQKPTNKIIPFEKSEPPAWKQIPSWYQISEYDRIISPDVERMFSKQVNSITTISLPSSHMSPISFPNEITKLIINAIDEVDIS